MTFVNYLLEDEIKQNPPYNLRRQAGTSDIGSHIGRSRDWRVVAHLAVHGSWILRALSCDHCGDLSESCRWHLLPTVAFGTLR